MTHQQKFFFDLKGWLLVPGVLSTTEAEAVRAHILSEGDPFSGPAQELLDHPVLIDILSELIGKAPEGADYYNFRCENSFPTIRRAGWHDKATSNPHSGPREGALRYQCNGQTIYSGLTRVVWELNPVRAGDGGTLFLSGSHKANFDFPPEVLQPDNEFMESYDCPAGSLLVFTETLLHAGSVWKNTEVDRVGIFSAYNSLVAQFHKLSLSHEKIAAMPPKRQSLFRGVYAHDFKAASHPDGVNRYYSQTNRAL